MPVHFCMLHFGLQGLDSLCREDVKNTAENLLLRDSTRLQGASCMELFATPTLEKGTT